MNPLKEELEQNGFCHIPNAFSQLEIRRLVEATQKTLDNPDFEYDFLKINKDQHIHKIRYMFEKDPIFTETLVHESILSILTRLISPKSSIVPTWEDMLIKVPFKGIPVTVHQDLALQSIGSDVFSVGIYLHDSLLNPVYYLPESHKKGALTRTEIYQIYKDDKDKFVSVKARAGDIVVHNVKTVHFSGENTSPDPRYTWYLEFRTIEQLLKDSPWDRTWITQRRAIWAFALKKYRVTQKKKNASYDDIDELVPDYEALKPYMNPLALRISHTNETIQYDMKSPYNHFSDE
tara:strand:+ start:318 stop:1190 length:873 start_codon:yes stop_codon:yes gene_type:complete